MPEIYNESSETRFTAEPGETILDAGLRQGSILPYSCRNGTCSSCKATLVSGNITYADADPAALTAADREAGKVLLCQAVAETDVTIRAREATAVAGITIKSMPCRVSKLKALAHDVMEVHLSLPKVQTLEYLAGQYIDIIMRDGRRRSFSIANRPQNGDDLELHIRHVPGGRFSTQVFESMKERDLLRFEGPLGTFFLREDTSAPVICVAGGTGFAPIKAIVEQAIERNERRDIDIYWGVRSARDLYMGDLAREWANTHANIRFTPVLSHPEEDGDTVVDDAATGWVHDAVLAAHPSLAGSEVYASGPPLMIDAIRESFLSAGLDEESLFYDSFEYAAS